VIYVPTSGFDIRRLLGVSLTVLFLGFGLAACGGSDDEDPPPATATTGAAEPAALTTESLIEQGDAICAEVNAALGSIASSTADETTKSSQLASIYDGLAERLGQLGTPTDGDPPTDVIAAVQDLADGTGDTAELTAAAEDYGFTDCAEAPEATSYPTDSTGTDTGDATGTVPEETYTPPATEAPPAPAPPATTPPSGGGTGGGVAPAPPPTSGGSSSGGAASGGIGPG